MARRVQIVDDTVESTSSSAPGNRPHGSWTWLLAGLAIGIGIGLLLIGASPAAQPEESVEATTPSELATPLEGGAGADIATLLPQVLGIEEIEAGGLQQIIGPVTGPFEEQPLPVDEPTEVALDRSGRWLGLVSETPEGQRVLMMGRLPRLAPVSTDVLSFAWHDSSPRRLSYIERTGEGEFALKVIEGRSEPQVVARGGQLEGDIAAWGDWGWALQKPEGSVALLDADGQLSSTTGGLALDSHGTGWIVTVTEGGLINMVIPGGGTVWMDIDYEPIGGVGMADLSPDRKKIALVGPVGVKVTALNLDDDPLMVRVASMPRAVSWSPDSRFVILSQRNGVMVLDTWASGGEKAVYELGSKSLLALSVAR